MEGNKGVTNLLENPKEGNRGSTNLLEDLIEGDKGSTNPLESPEVGNRRHTSLRGNPKGQVGTYLTIDNAIEKRSGDRMVPLGGQEE